MNRFTENAGRILGGKKQCSATNRRQVIIRCALLFFGNSIPTPKIPRPGDCGVMLIFVQLIVALPACFFRESLVSS